MKRAQRQVEAPKSAVHIATRTRIQRKSHPGVGNHHRADSREEEAEGLARRVARGEQGVARHVSAAPASGYRIARSSGQPLPQPLRRTMEDALGADLREVRIHSGAAADLAAQQFGAEAFTSGRNIYFRRGTFDPNSVKGETLLAHELVHTLQQTGRATSDGRLRVTTLTGSGLVQRQQQTPANPAAAVATPAEQRQAFTFLAERYRQRSAASDLQQTIDDVSTLLDGRLDISQPAFAQDFRAAVNARRFNTRSGDARGFVLDCLKIMHFFQDAYLLLDRDTRLEIRVATAQLDFLEFLEMMPRAAAWAGEALRHADLREFWPGAIVRGYRDFLLKPHSAPPGENVALRDRHKAEIQRRNEINISTELVPQERVLLAWIVLHEMDLLRVEVCGEAQSTSGTTAQITATEGRQRVLVNLRDREQRIIDDDTQPAYRRLLAEQLMKVIEEVAPIWTGTMEAYAAWQAQFQGFTDRYVLDAPAARFPHSPLTTPFLADLRQGLVAQAQNLLALNDGEPELPAPAVYEERLGAFRGSLSDSVGATRRRTLQPLFQRLDEAILSAARARRPVQATVRALTLLSLILDRLVQLTLHYDRTADDASPHFPDQRAAHRIRMARSLAWLARWMQWPDLLEACRSTLTADNAGEVELWLVSEWEPEERLPIDRLSQDFQGNLNVPVIRDTPLTIRHLVEWFHFDYNRRLRATLQELVRPEARATAGTQVDIGRINALRQSREEVRGAMAGTAEAEQDAKRQDAPVAKFDLRVPQRFRVRDWEVAIPPGKRPEWDRLIETRQKTQLSLARHRADGNYSVMIFPTSVDQGVFAWMLPSIRPLIAMLRRLSSLRAIGGEEGVDDEAWLKRLSPEQLSEAQWEEVNQRIQSHLEQSNEQVSRDLPDLWLRLNILRRRILIMLIRPALSAFVENRSVAFGPGGESDAARGARLSAPLDMVSALEGYEAAVVPSESAPVQTTLFLLGLADLLQQVVTESDPQGDFGRRIYPYLLTALNFLDGDAQKIQQLRQGSNAYDEAGSILYIDSNLQTSTRQLRALKNNIDNSYRAAQQTIGIVSEDGRTLRPHAFHTPIYPSHRPGDVHEWTTGNTVDENGQLDPSTGTRYRLIEVYQRFTYHPAVGSLNGRGPGTGPRYIDENGVEYPRISESGQREPIPHVPIFRMEINGTAREVFADDAPFLGGLNDIILWRSVQIQMENLSYLTEEYMKWVVAVMATVLPGATYAEIVTTVMQFILTGELEEIVRQLRDDPANVLQRLVERLRTELFTPENVWRFVLLGGQHSPFNAIAGMAPDRPRQRTTVPPSSRLGRIIFRLRQLGRKFNDALRKVRDYADGPIRSVQGFIAMRPTLAWLLRRAAHLIEAAIDLIPPGVLEGIAGGKLPGSPKELADAVSSGIEDTAGDMEKSVVRLLETIQHFELPYEILDLGAATELILGFIADRFGPRARIVRMVLQIIPIPQEHEGRFTGMRTLYQAICGEIARIWRDTPVDPNTYWRDQIIPVVGDKFRETRDDLVSGVYHATDVFLDDVGRPRLPRPSALPETEVEAVQEAEASFPSDPRAPGPGSWRLATSGGSPIPTPLRHSFESRFGQQFSHVRLHQGAAARDATQPIGADAVTSGSHVFLAPSRPLAGARGRHLLGHELTHVLQQTGSHPLGGSPPAVREGRPQRGLLLDSSREAQAEHAAGRIAAGLAVPPLQTGVFNGGPQPALGERVVNSVIDTITTAKESGDFTETPRGGAAHVPGIDVARQLWTRTRECINEAGFANFLQTPAGLGSIQGVSNADVRELIKQQLRDRHEELIGKKVPGIAQLAQRPKRNRQQNDPETELNTARFVNLLEDFIAAERGIALQIDFNAADNTITGIRVHNVLLQNIGGNSGLWRIAMHASFSSHSTDVPDLSAAQGEIRQRLRNTPPTPLIFSPASFQFSMVFVNDYLDLVRSRGRSVDDIPKVGEYTKPENNRGDSLAVSTHGDLRSRGIGQFGRESHHTTQYLLVEFFGNLPDASRPAFPPHHAYPTGIEFQSGNSGVVRAIHGAGRSLNIDSLNPNSGRGDNMPAILLSKRTHQRGELHVLREARWDPGANNDTESRGTVTQGFAIENVFNRNLPPELRPHDNSEAHRVAFRETVNRDPAGANRDFYNAAKATYHWMYNRMIPALESGLQSEEMAYYRGVAALRHRMNADSAELQRDYEMQPHHLRRVFTAAKKKNDEVMSAAGWPTP